MESVSNSVEDVYADMPELESIDDDYEMPPIVANDEMPPLVDDDELIRFNNGVFNIDSGVFNYLDTDNNGIISTGYDWIEYSAGNDTLKKLTIFLQKIFPNKEMREYVLEQLASFTHGKRFENNFNIWFGTGNNGKSTFAQLLQEAFGEYYGRMENMYCMNGLCGKRIVMMEEPVDNECISLSTIKKFLSDDKICARPLYHDEYSYTPKFKMIMMCNSLPQQLTDQSINRRIRIIPFETEFSNEPIKPKQLPSDHTISMNFSTWKSAFMWLLLRVYYPKYVNQSMNILQ